MLTGARFAKKQSNEENLAEKSESNQGKTGRSTTRTGSVIVQETRDVIESQHSLSWFLANLRENSKERLRQDGASYNRISIMFQGLGTWLRSTPTQISTTSESPAKYAKLPNEGLEYEFESLVRVSFVPFLVVVLSFIKFVAHFFNDTTAFVDQLIYYN